MKKVFLLLVVLVMALSFCLGITGCEQTKGPSAPNGTNVSGPTFAPATAKPMTENVSLEFVSHSGGEETAMNSITVKWTNSSEADILISPEGKLNRSNNGLYRELGDIKSGEEAVKLAAGESMEIEYSVECSGTETKTTYLIQTSYEELQDNGSSRFPAEVSFDK